MTYNFIGRIVTPYTKTVSMGPGIDNYGRGWESKIPIGLTKQDFEKWKENWLMRIPKCKRFCCVHECTSCAIDLLCACGSIWETYSKQKNPIECTTVDCMDCFLKYECKG